MNDDISQDHIDESPGSLSFKTSQKSKMVKNESNKQESIVIQSTNQSELANIFDSIKKRTNLQKNELKEKHQKELSELNKKYLQIKEQLRVTQRLMDARESNERGLQDQLNKTTIELAQLRLIREDLNSSLKQATAQIQFLNKELDKIRDLNTKGENELQQKNFEMKEKIAQYEQEINKIKNDFNSSQEKFKVEKDQLKSQLKIARKQMNKWQDENIKIINESREISSKYESEKANFILAKQKLSEMQSKNGKLNEISLQLREENEKLNDCLMEVKSENQSLKLKYDKCLSERNIFESQIKPSQEKIKKLNSKLYQAELVSKSSSAKSAALEDELRHNQELLEKSKQTFLSDINNLNQLYLQEKEINQNLKNENQQFQEENNENKRELDYVKRFKEKLEKSEADLKKRVVQSESLFHESEKERFQLTNQIQKLNEEIELKEQTIGEVQSQLNDALKDNLQLKESLNDANKKINDLSSSANTESLAELKQNLASKLSENQILIEQNKSLQNQLKDLKLTSEQISDEKQNDIQIINELKESLSKERDNLKISIQERKSIQEQNQSYRHELLDVKRQLSKLQSELSLANAENSHMKTILNENQNTISSLTDEKNHLKNDLNALSDLYNNEKTSHVVFMADHDSLKKEVLTNKKLLDQFKSKEKSLQDKIESLNKELSKSKSDFSNINKNANDLQIQLSDLQNQYEGLQKNLSLEQQEKEKYALKCATLESQVTSINSDLKSANEQLESNKLILFEKNKKISELSIKLDQYKEINNHLNSENDSLANEKQRLLQKANDTEKRLSEALNNQNELNSKITSDMKETLENLRKEKSSLSEKALILEQKLKDSDNHVEELQEIINNLQDEAKIKEDDQNKFQSQCYDLQRQISDNAASMQSMKLINEEQSELLAQLRDEKKLLKNQIETLEHQNKVDRLNLETYYNQNLELLKTKYQYENGELSNAEKDLKDKIITLENENNNLNKEFREFKRQTSIIVQKHKNSIAQIEQLSKQREELISENTELKTSLVSQVQSFNILDQQKQQVIQERNNLLAKIQELNGNINEITSSNSELEKIKIQFEESQKSLAKMKQEIKSLNSLNADLKNELDEANRSREDASKQFEEMTQTVQQIHHLLKPSSNEELEMAKEGEFSSNSQFVKELSVLRNLLISSHNEIESFIKERTRLFTEVSRLKKKISKLNDSKNDFTNKLNDSNKKINDLLQELANMKEAHLKYNQERNNLNNGISKLRNALQMTKEKLEYSETEKKSLKEDKLNLKILIDRICDDHKIDIRQFQKVQ